LGGGGEVGGRFGRQLKKRGILNLFSFYEENTEIKAEIN
jgi:hypothetical protein